MKLFVAFTLALFFAPAFAAADAQEEPRDGLIVDVLRITGKGVYVTWSPAPLALSYQVFRGPDLAHLEFIGQTPALQFADWHAPEQDTWYQIVSVGGLQNGLNEIIDGGPMKGSCLAMRGGTGVAITAANCMPANGPDA